MKLCKYWINTDVNSERRNVNSHLDTSLKTNNHSKQNFNFVRTIIILYLYRFQEIAL